MAEQKLEMVVLQTFPRQTQPTIQQRAHEHNFSCPVGAPASRFRGSCGAGEFLQLDPLETGEQVSPYFSQEKLPSLDLALVVELTLLGNQPQT